MKRFALFVAALVAAASSTLWPIAASAHGGAHDAGGGHHARAFTDADVRGGYADPQDHGRKDALRNAAVPVITVIGTGFALLISGVVVTESVFNLPGIGRLTVDAVLARDFPVIQAMILLTSGVYVGVNLLIDLAYALLDPRIRY